MHRQQGAEGGAPARRTPHTALGFALVALAMFAFGYAMEPLYYRLCAALGIDVAESAVLEETKREAAAPRAMRMEFDANSHNDVVAMVPSHRTSSLRTGAAYRIDYEISNLTGGPVSGVAVPSFSPERAARWVKKLRCFCFDEVALAANETKVEPVVFVVDRALPREIGAVALSYTFFPKEGGGHAH